MLDSETFRGTPSSNIPDLSGITIDEGRLLLVNAVGRGAWGVVYRAEDTAKPGQYYAVKCMCIGLMTDHQQRSVEKEVAMHSICADSSPNVVQIVKVIEDDDSGMLFIVTEFCDGGDLLEHIVSHKYIGNDEHIRRTYIQILDAIEACHNNSVYHRDLKPENILVKDGGKTIVVADFGFATTKQITADFRLGSEPFMSPEVRGGVHVRLQRFSSRQADIWALGIILMNLITGCLPWGKASSRDSHFVRYALQDRDYLYNTFPISRGANEILKSIFTVDPRKRTSIADLRRRILELNTFGPGRFSKPKLNSKTGIPEDIDSEADSETDSDTLSDPDDSKNVDQELEEATLHVVNGPVVSEVDITDAARTGNIAVVFPVAPEDLQRPAASTRASRKKEISLDEHISIKVVPPEPITEADITDEIYAIDSDSDSNSVADSEGPITPETRAVDEPAVAGAAAAGVAALENISELADLGLGDAGTSSTLEAAVFAAAQIRAEAKGKGKGKKSPIQPLRRDARDDDVAAFVPSERTTAVGKVRDAYKGAKTHPPTKRMFWSAARVMGVPVRRKDI